MDTRATNRERRAQRRAVRKGQRVGRHLARLVQADMGLAMPSQDAPSAALIGALARARGWAITVRDALPDERRRRGYIDGEHAHLTMSEVRPLGPATWEVIVYQPASMWVVHELAALSALAYVLRDDVPLPGRTCDARGPRDYAAGVADGFARALFALLCHGPGADRALDADDPLDEPERTLLDGIIAAVGLVWGILGLGLVGWALLTHQPEQTLYVCIFGGLGVPGMLGLTRAQADVAEGFGQDREDAGAAAAELGRVAARAPAPAGDPAP